MALALRKSFQRLHADLPHIGVLAVDCEGVGSVIISEQSGLEHGSGAYLVNLPM